MTSKILPKLLALYHPQKPSEKAFFEELAQTCDYLLSLTIQSAEQAIDTDAYQGILAFETLKTSLPFCSLELIDPDTVWEEPKAILRLLKTVTIFTQTLSEQLLKMLPFNQSLASKNGLLLYDNSQPDGAFSFAEEENDGKTIHSWILQRLTETKNGTLYFPLPSESFDHILMQSYQALYDDEGKLQGVFQQVQDIRPLLKTYLEDSAQALVGWSDVTSGASISNSSLEDDF